MLPMVLLSASADPGRPQVDISATVGAEIAEIATCGRLRGAVSTGLFAKRLLTASMMKCTYIQNRPQVDISAKVRAVLAEIATCGRLTGAVAAKRPESP